MQESIGSLRLKVRAIDFLLCDKAQNEQCPVATKAKVDSGTTSDPTPDDPTPDTHLLSLRLP